MAVFRRITVEQRKLIRALERELGLPEVDLTGVSQDAASEQIGRLLYASGLLDLLYARGLPEGVSGPGDG